MLFTCSLVPVGKGKNEFNSLKLVIVQNNCYSKNTPIAGACVRVKGEIAIGFSPGIQFPILSISMKETKYKIAYLTVPGKESYTQKEVFHISSQVL